MSLFWWSWANNSSDLNYFINYYWFAWVESNATFRDLTIWRTIELLWTLPEIINATKSILKHFATWETILPEEHKNWRYNYSRKQLDWVSNIPLDLCPDNVWCLINDYHQQWRSIPWYVIEVLLYNSNYVKIRDWVKWLIYSLEDRNKYLNQLDSVDTNNTQIIERYQMFDNLYTELKTIPIDWIVNDEFLA